MRPAFQLATILVNDSVIREAITKKEERTFLNFIKNDTHYRQYYDGMYILFKDRDAHFRIYRTDVIGSGL